METDMKVGARAPDFRLESTSGRELSLSDFRGQIVVLYFYPKDDTPGCTREACAFRDASAEMNGLGVVTLGVSKDSLQSHTRFKEKHGLNFPLLSDPQGQVISAYDSWKPGKAEQSVSRSTFLIDQHGIIRQIWRGVRVEGHDEQVLSAVRGLDR